MRGSKPLLSIVLPVKNEGANLMMICESISQQPYKDFFEVVLVDDSDPQYEVYVSRCFDLLARAGVKVKRLRGSGAGVGDAMFIGLKASEVEHVLFLDTNNILTHNFMASIINHLKEGAFVSFLSKSIISCRIPALLSMLTPDGMDSRILDRILFTKYRRYVKADEGKNTHTSHGNSRNRYTGHRCGNYT